MKVRRQLERLEPMVLGPVDGLNSVDWHRAPEGKWSVCQILQHLAMGVDIVAEAFERGVDHAPMKRRTSPHQTIVRHLLLGVDRIPVGVTGTCSSPRGTRSGAGQSAVSHGGGTSGEVGKFLARTETARTVRAASYCR